MVQVDLLQDVVGVVVFLKIGFVIGVQVVVEFQVVVGVQCEGEQVYYQVFVGFGWMLGQGQVVGCVVVVIYVVDLQFGFVDGGGKSYGGFVD